MAVVAFAVVPDLLDDVVHPLLIDADGFAEAGRDAEEALDGRVVALQHFIDVLRGDAHLLGLDHAHQHPFHQIEPLVVAVAHDRTQRFLGNALGQDDMLALAGELADPRRGQARGVGGVAVATARGIGLQQLVELLDQHRLEGHLVLAEIVREVEFGGGAGLHADGGAVQFPGALDAALGRHHEALAIVEIDAGDVEAERGVAQQGLRGVARDDIDLARLQGDETLLRGGRRVLGLLRIAEQGGGNGAAEIDVEPRPLALAVGEGEAGEARVDRALHETLGLDGVESGAGESRGRGQQRQRRGEQGFLDH